MNAQNYVQCFRVTASVPNLIVKLMVSKIQSNVFDLFSSKMIRYILYRPGKNLIPGIQQRVLGILSHLFLVHIETLDFVTPKLMGLGSSSLEMVPLYQLRSSSIKVVCGVNWPTVV